MSLRRLRTDLTYAVFVMLALAGVLGIGPFAIYRFVAGEWQAGAVDLALVAALLAALAYVSRGGDVAHASHFVVVTILVACLVASHFVGNAGVFWTYPLIAATFLLLRRGPALLLTSLLVVVMMLDAAIFENMLERLMYLASALVACVIAYAFARHGELQQRKLEALAARDPLTGVANRRAMERELHIAAEAFRRQRAPAGLLVMDLDHFKRINDAYGHEAGDDVLVEFTRAVQARCRAGDRLFRWGGEEFVLLLPATAGDVLRTVAESIRGCVAERVRAGGTVVTVSIGGAVLRAGEDNAAWLGRADAAMYEAKKAGRDRVVVEDA